jgi:hypothetical protein
MRGAIVQTRRVGQARGGAAMTGSAIDLDGRRTTKDKVESLMRRRAANARSAPDAGFGKADVALDAAMMVEPARSWIQAMDKARFLLDQYSAIPEARDARIQKLIGRALGDMARLKKQEKNGT